MANILAVKKGINWLKISKIIVFVLLLSFVLIIFCQKTELSGSDLGRHIQNGKMVFSHPELLYTNFYSYTEPGNRFVNHHWFSGVIYNIVYQIGGFKLLSVFNILLALLIFSLYFYKALKKSNFYSAAILSLPVIYLLSERVEVRPEMFSYLFFIITWLILEAKNWTYKKKYISLFFLFVLWANMHIYFFLGLALVFFYVFNCLIKRRLWQNIRTRDWRGIFKKSKKEIILFGILIIASVATPNHIKGLLYPFNIFKEYGYEIAENKSVFFLENLILNYNYLIYKLLLVTLVISLLANYLFLKKKDYLQLFLGLTIIVISLPISRNISFFALVSLVVVSPILYDSAILLIAKLKSRGFNSKNIHFYTALSVYAVIIVISCLLFAFSLPWRYRFLSKDLGLGLTDGSLQVYEYFKDNDLKGPIFNNYDTGSAIIFGLNGKEKVFVDNRPEAYTVSFFQDIYKPMQLNELRFESQLEKYGFNTIIFSHTDSTPWGKTFVRSILANEDWELVYFDRYYLVLIRKEAYGEEYLASHHLSEAYLRDNIRSKAEKSNNEGGLYYARLAETLVFPDIAIEIYRQILFKQANNYKAVFALAYLYSTGQNREDLSNALVYFRKGLKIEPNMPGAYRNMGLIYWKLQEYEMASEYWHLAIKKNRLDKQAKDYLKQMEEFKNKGVID